MIFRLWFICRIVCETLFEMDKMDTLCVLEEYSTQCSSADIDQVCVPTVNEMVWEFPHGLQSKVLLALFQPFIFFIFPFFSHVAQ